MNSYTGKLNTCSNIAWHRPQSTCDRQEDELMEKSSRAVSHTTDPLEKLRLLCLSHGVAGIMDLGRIFRHNDDGSKLLNKEEFATAIRDTGLDLSEEDAENLFDRLVTDNSGLISLEVILKQIQSPLSEYRRAIIEKCFHKLDKSGKGEVTIKDIRAAYDVKSNPRYMSGEETADVILDKFMLNFETKGEEDGKVTLEEFMNYYSGISVSIDNDCYFDLMMRQIYKL